MVSCTNTLAWSEPIKHHAPTCCFYNFSICPGSVWPVFTLLGLCCPTQLRQHICTHSTNMLNTLMNLKGKAQAALKRILKRRKLVFPRSPFPLVLPFLSNSSFHTEIVAKLKQQVSNCSHMFPPGYLPSTKLIPAAHPSLGKALFNRNKWHKSFIEQNPTCNCAQLRQQHTNVNTRIGCVFCGFDKYETWFAEALDGIHQFIETEYRN